MTQPLKVPSFGESIVEGTIVRWLKNIGDAVKMDEAVVEIETDKITVEVNAPAAGSLSSQKRNVGDRVTVGEVIGELEEGAAGKAAPQAVVAPVAEAPKLAVAPGTAQVSGNAMPAARRLAEESGVSLSQVSGTGRGGRVLKEDVAAVASGGGAAAAVAKKADAPPAAAPQAKPAPRVLGQRQTRRVTMTPLRQRVAQRLVEAQTNAAILTTFNECDMGAVMELRKRHQERFVERHGIKLGFMSFFVKAAVEALKSFPLVNASIEESEIVYHDYYDIGVAVGGGKGLVVPVVRDADALGFAELEKSISDYGVRAKANKLTLDELSGGTFTISNGGVYGSMMSTPILNPPQSGILGMHNITERAMVRDGQVVVRPMMYLALSYDHRIVDGREAVQFLVRIKECIENPERLLLEV